MNHGILLKGMKEDQDLYFQGLGADYKSDHNALNIILEYEFKVNGDSD